MENFEEQLSKEEFVRRMEDMNDLGLKLEDIHGRVLDVGAGGGELVDFLKKNTNAEIVVGIDPVSKEKDGARVIFGSASDIPFADNNFDHVISYASIPNLIIGLYSPDHPEHSEKEMTDQTYRAFKEMLRVLKEGSEIKIAPIIFAENYESQKAKTRAINSTLSKLEEEGYEYSLEFLRKVTNPENEEQHDDYRLTITKPQKS